MQPATAVTALAPSPSAAKAPANTIELFVGRQVAAAGLAILEALDERQHGGLTPRTRQRGGDAIAALYGLRNFLIVDYPGFDGLAREHGVAALRAAGVSPTHADVLADEVLILLAKVVRTALN
jgi:hypothetical protein